MFSGDNKLVGGNGTTYSSSNTNYTYARIDTNDTPGYFTNYLTPRVSTRVTPSTIMVVVSLDSSYANITKYEFSKDNGSTWIDNGTSNIYTFTNLTKNTSYPILVRITDSSNNTELSKLVNVTTSLMPIPTYEQTNNDITNVDVEITYPEGCGSTYTCSYTKDGGNAVSVTSVKATVNFTASGNIVATVNDGTNTESSSYTVSMPTTLNTHNTSMLVVNVGDGLYEDSTVNGRYIYKGGNPNNYIKLGNEEYRIIALEADGTIKVIRNNRLGIDSTRSIFDPGYATSIPNVTNASSMEGTRWTDVSTDYCYYSTSTTSYNGCNVWGSKTTVLDTNGNNVTIMPRQAGSSTTYDLPTKEAYINTYLNSTYLSSFPNSIQSKIVNHLFNIGPVANNSSMATNMSQEASYKWMGKIGLMNLTDYVKGSKNTSCTSVSSYYSTANCYNKSLKHNYLYKPAYGQWTMNSYSSSSSYQGWYVNSDAGNFSYANVNGTSYYIRPVFYLDSTVNLSGSGTENDPYEIIN